MSMPSCFAPSRWAVRLGLVAAVAAAGSLAPVAASAKTLDIVGIVDCGLSSGHRCEIGDVLMLRTKDITGKLETVEIDVSWIKADLEGTDQDDFLRFELEEKPGGGYQALRIYDPDQRERAGEEDDVQNGQDADEEEEEEERGN